MRFWIASSCVAVGESGAELQRPAGLVEAAVAVHELADADAVTLAVESERAPEGVVERLPLIAG